MSAKKTIDRTYKFSTTGLFVFCGAFALVGAYFLWQAFAATTCLVSNRTTWSDGVVDCTVGTTLTRTNAGFACNQPLSSYGTLPLKVVIVSTGAWDAPGAVTLDNGCSGDNNPDTIDLVVDIQGNGPKSSTGPGHDSFKTRQSPGPRDIQVTGRMECGRQAPAAHQDMMQFQGGTNITIVNATSGNYSVGTSTCQGAGGVIFSSAVNNLDILGGAFMGCNHGILGGSPSSNPGGEVRDTKFRSGRTDGSDPNCTGFSASPPCQSDLPMANVTCGRWNASRWIDEVMNPSNNPPSPPPPSNQPTVTLSANPTSVASGQSSTLNWSSTNATTCTASGAWTGNRNTSGSQAVSPTLTSVYNLSCTGSGGTANASVTLSVTASPSPPSSGGTTIRVTSGSWTCDRPLSQYGSLPITLIHTARVLEDAVSISSNCTGDTNPNTIDLILNINGNGSTIGTGQDAVKVGSPPGTTRPHDIQITGYAECGGVTAGAHQDVIQILSGERIQFIDFKSGNANTRTFTCRGAGGAFFPTSTSPGDPNRQPEDVVCIRCEFVTSNHGLFIGWSLRSGARDSTFIAQRPSTIDGAVEPVNVNNTFTRTGESGNPPPPTPIDTPPSVSITSPVDGSTVTGTVNVTATASDNNSVARVEFYVDGTLRATDNSSPYSYSWNTASLANGSHSIIARAYDNANNNASDQHSVNVNNGDTTAPTAPAGLTATASAHNRVNLSWTASTDNVGVAGYYIVRNGTTIAQANGTATTYPDTTVNSSTAYTYRVIAFDARGNNSPASNQVEVRTPAPPNAADTIAPSTPASLAAIAASPTQINLSWRASTDNVGVTGYEVYRSTAGSAAVRIATVTTTSYGSTGLSPATAYSYYVVARDGAGNVSVPSLTATATTASPPANPGVSYGSLRGRVVSNRGAGLRAHVNINVGGRVQYHTTNTGGSYTIQKLPAGSHQTKYRANGYQHQYITNTIVAGQTAVKNVTLQAR